MRARGAPGAQGGDGDRSLLGLFVSHGVGSDDDQLTNHICERYLEEEEKLDIAKYTKLSPHPRKEKKNHGFKPVVEKSR